MSLAICLMIKDERPYLAEWLAFHALVGVSHFRIYDSGGTVCGIQGTITATAGGGDMTLDNTSIASGQQVTITSFTLTDANA